MTTFELSEQQVCEINGGFVCGGLCVGGLFLLGTGAGALVTSWIL